RAARQRLHGSRDRRVGVPVRDTVAPERRTEATWGDLRIGHCGDLHEAEQRLEAVVPMRQGQDAFLPIDPWILLRELAESAGARLLAGRPWACAGAEQLSRRR